MFFTGLWFLTVLFVLTVIGIFLYKRFRGKVFYLGWFITWGIFYVLPDIWVLNQIEYLLPFYVLGIASHKIKWEVINIGISLVSLIVFCICFSNFSFEDSMYMMGSDVFCFPYLYGTMIRLVGGVSGILCSIAFVRFVMMRLCVNISLIPVVGTMTLPIYVLHQKFLVIDKALNYHTSNIVILIFSSLCLLYISIFMYKVLRKNRYAALLLFGEMKNNSL